MGVSLHGRSPNRKPYSFRTPSGKGLGEDILMLLQVDGADAHSRCWQRGSADQAELSLEQTRNKMTLSPNQSSAYFAQRGTCISLRVVNISHLFGNKR